MATVLTTSLLSAAKTGNPNLLGQSLSGFGVNIISLSTNDVGISFSTITPLTSVLFTAFFEGSQFAIDTAYTGQVFALVKVPLDSGKFTYARILSTGVVAISAGQEIWTNRQRRKHWLGYF